MSEKIYQFDKSLLNTMISPKHETLDKDGKKVTYRLVKGDSELIMKKQRDNAEPISFRVYNTIIPIKDTTTQEWLESKPWFGRLCNIYDPVSENQNKVKEVKDNLKTVMKVMELDNYSLLGLGYQLFGQASLDQVKREGNDFSGLKIDVAAKANEDPALIEELLSKENAAYTMFGLAFAKGIIKEDESGTAISWGDEGGAKIMTVTPGVKPLKAIVEYSTTTEGATVKQLIGQRMTNEAVDKKAKDAAKDDDQATAPAAGPRKAGRPAAIKEEVPTTTEGAGDDDEKDDENEK